MSDAPMPRTDLSRAEAIRRGLLALGGIYGFGLIGPFPRSSLAIVGENDLDSLNFLMPFEYLQVDFYQRALAGKPKPTPRMASLFEMLLEQEEEHVAMLTEEIQNLGGEPVKKGSYAFAYFGYFTMLSIAKSLEHSAAGLYNGLIPLIEAKELRAKLGTIAQVEARHLAAILLELDDDPSEAFEFVYPPFQALESIVKYTGYEIWREG